MKLEECLAVHDNPVEKEDQEEAPRRVKPPTVKRPGRGKSAKKPPPRRGRKASASSSSSDSELENQPPRRRKGQAERKIYDSESDDEPAVQKQAPARPSRSSKVIQEPTSSGKKRLSENNSF